jgi:hypothetical protein
MGSIFSKYLTIGILPSIQCLWVLWRGLSRHRTRAVSRGEAHELSFNEAVRLLCEYGLAHPEPSLGQRSGSEGYGVHSCVHSWTIFVLNNKWDDGLAQLALTCVASEVPSTDTDKWWLLQQRLLQHIARHEQFITNGNIDVERMEWALHNLGDLCKDQGRLAEAEAMYNRALQGYEEALGPKHTSTLGTVNNLGLLYACSVTCILHREMGVLYSAVSRNS